jgi:hypothetical protein
LAQRRPLLNPIKASGWIKVRDGDLKVKLSGVCRATLQ